MNKRSDEKGDPFGPFNLSDFKKWMENQQDAKPKTHWVGRHVESRVPVKRLLHRIETENDDVEEVAKDFKKNGGVINEIDGQNLVIEVDSGTFRINRHYVKKTDD